jgi:hypothetical protein
VFFYSKCAEKAILIIISYMWRVDTTDMVTGGVSGITVPKTQNLDYWVIARVLPQIRRISKTKPVAI